MGPFALARLAEASVTGQVQAHWEALGGLAQPHLHLVPPLLVAIALTSGGRSWGFTLSGVTGSVARLVGVINTLPSSLSDLTQ